MQLLDHGANQLSAFNEMIGLDPLGRVKDEARYHGADTDAGAIVRGFDHEALEPFIAQILPFEDDLHAVADLERFSAAARYWLIHELM